MGVAGWPGLRASVAGIARTTPAAPTCQKKEPEMYIGIGTLILIIILVLVLT